MAVTVTLTIEYHPETKTITTQVNTNHPDNCYVVELMQAKCVTTFAESMRPAALLSLRGEAERVH